MAAKSPNPKAMDEGPYLSPIVLAILHPIRLLKLIHRPITQRPCLKDGVRTVYDIQWGTQLSVLTEM